MKKFVCENPWTHFEVNNPNGDVTMCCDNATVLGNVNDDTIEGVWNGDGYRTMRKRMRNEGAHAFCPHTCPVLQGGKRYQNLDWFAELAGDSPARLNAEKNEKEFAEGAVDLQSLPRWMRFAYSYACNLDCYHCYQRDDALLRAKLPPSFMTRLTELAPTYQVVLPFGGEPFLYRPVLDFIEDDPLSSGCKYFFITNATLFTERVKESLATKELLGMAVSLDAATEKSFDILRLRGRTASWDDVLDSLAWLCELNKKKDFEFSISMTLNSVNHDEIERFVDLGLGFDAEPDILLVANPDQTLAFQKEFLHFTDAQFDEMFAQIERALVKVRERGFKDAETSLDILRNTLILHRRADNNLAVFTAKNYARSALRRLPENMQDPIRKAVQSVRASMLENATAAKG